MRRRSRRFRSFLVLVWLLSSVGTPPVGASDDVAPTPVVSLEGVYTTNDITFAGTAEDDSAVTRVRVGFKQARTKLWLQKDGTFGPKIQKFDAELGEPGAPTTTWSYDATLPDGEYVLSLRAFDDTENTASIRPWARFIVDTTGPVIEVAFPPGATLLGPDVVLNGRLVDRTFIGVTLVAVRDTDSGLWLQEDGSFGADKWEAEVPESTCRPDWREFCLAGTTNDSDETIMAFTHTATLPPGSYQLAMRVSDSDGNLSRVTRPFTVDPSIDTLPTPSTDVVAGDVVAGPDIVLEGAATDDIGIARVLIGIKDRDTGRWWGGFGWADRPVRIDAHVVNLGGSPATWRLETELPDGRYALSVRAFDVQGYSDSVRPWVKFSIDSTA